MSKAQCHQIFFAFKIHFRIKERTYSRLQNKPGVKPFGPLFVNLLAWEHGAVVGGKLVISTKKGGKLVNCRNNN